MYGTRNAAGVVGVGSLAYTGVNTGFWVLTALVVIVCGVTVVRLSRSRPSQMHRGPKRK